MKKAVFKPSGARFGCWTVNLSSNTQNAKFSRFWACTAKSLNFSQVHTFRQSFPRRYFYPLSVLIIFLFKVSNFSKSPKYLLFGAYFILRVYFDGMALCQNWHSSLFKFTKNTQIVIIWGKLAFQKSLLHPECRRAASIPSTGKAICHHCLVPADGGRPAILILRGLAHHGA